MMRKKGAIEMSMQTIIIVIIGVTLLGLGVKFVVDTMSDVGEMSENVMGKGDKRIDEIFGDSDEMLNLMPGELEVGRGDSDNFEVHVRNTGFEKTKFSLSLDVSDAPSEAAATTAKEWLKLSRKESTLSDGSATTILLVVNPPKSAKLGIYMVSVIVTCDDSETCPDEEIRDVIITVEA